jgi:hypothetical protein
VSFYKQLKLAHGKQSKSKKKVDDFDRKGKGKIVESDDSDNNTSFNGAEGFD